MAADALVAALKTWRDACYEAVARPGVMRDVAVEQATRVLLRLVDTEHPPAVKGGPLVGPADWRVRVRQRTAAAAELSDLERRGAQDPIDHDPERKGPDESHVPGPSNDGHRACGDEQGEALCAVGPAMGERSSAATRRDDVAHETQARPDPVTTLGEVAANPGPGSSRNADHRVGAGCQVPQGRRRRVATRAHAAPLRDRRRIARETIELGRQQGMDLALEQARLEGERARQQGLGRRANPYPLIHRALRRAWSAGVETPASLQEARP